MATNSLILSVITVLQEREYTSLSQEVTTTLQYAKGLRKHQINTFGHFCHFTYTVNIKATQVQAILGQIY